IVTKMLAGKSAGIRSAKYRSAPTPPAEVPIARISRLAIFSSLRPIGMQQWYSPFGSLRSSRCDIWQFRANDLLWPIEVQRETRVVTGSKQPGDADDSKPIIVGIGASAGGIQALQACFEALPEDTGAAFVVVIHLAPDRSSELAHVLSAR